MIVTKKYLDELTYEIIGCAIEIHRILGPGLLESIYEKCFCRELTLRGINYKNQSTIDLDYKGLLLDALLRFDVLAEDILLVELKSIACFLPIHDAILLSYMRLLKKPKGILINFNCINIFKQGQKTLVNDLYNLLPHK